MHTTTKLWITLFLLAIGLGSCQESATGKQGSKEQAEVPAEESGDNSLGIFIVDVNATHLRLREGPGKDYAVIGKLYKGAKVIGDKGEYEHNQSDWLKVKQEGSELIGYVHKDYIRPYSTEYYTNLSKEYFPLQVGNYWMYHVEPVTQDLWAYNPKKLEITGRKPIMHDGEQTEVYRLKSEDDNLIKLWVELLGTDGDGQISLSGESPGYNSFVRKGGKVYFGKYDGRLELGPVVFDPESQTLEMLGGDGKRSYLHEKDFDDIRYAQRGERVSPNFPICQYKYLSNDLGDELHAETRAVFAQNMGLYEIVSSSDALSGLILCEAKILSKPERIDDDIRHDRASASSDEYASTDPSNPKETDPSGKDELSTSKDQVKRNDKRGFGDYALSWIKDYWLYLVGLIWLIALIVGLFKAKVFQFRLGSFGGIKFLRHWVEAAKAKFASKKVRSVALKIVIIFAFFGILDMIGVGNGSSPPPKKDLRVLTYKVDDTKDIVGSDIFGLRFVFIEGEVKNFGDIAYSRFEVTAFFLNENEDVVEVASTYVYKDIFPGMQRPFLIKANLNTDYRKIRLEIENELIR